MVVYNFHDGDVWCLEICKCLGRRLESTTWVCCAIIIYSFMSVTWIVIAHVINRVKVPYFADNWDAYVK